ncbi:MAG TPA: hypothetical protein VLW65_04270 [Bryobacteraceae bacterium]|nr:hypothetical protein [Bryobacteraceae bacterium]
MNDHGGGTGFRIPCARIEEVVRREPGKTSVGDRATVRLDAGIVGFLETPLLGTGMPIGAGYQAPFTVPFGIAATAAYALIAPMQTGGVDWTGRDVEIQWSAAAGPADSLVAEAEVTDADERAACFAFSARTGGGRELLTGRLRLRAVRDGKAIGSPLSTASSTPEAVRERLAGHVLLAWVDAPATLQAGRVAPVRAGIFNPTSLEATATAALRLPPGAGLSLEAGDAAISVTVPAHSLREVEWLIRADRPDEVNFRRPWAAEVGTRLEDIEESHTVHISVAGSQPGRVFYVLNEDCETFDGGPLTGNYGASSVLGNANNFMDPEDYRIQMVEKPARMNEIADRHGARWTHFWCVPQRFAADWAAAQSTTGAWPQIAAALDESVRRGSARHEYAPHIHFDYEPDSRHPPQPRLLYDAATDGILPNQYYDPLTNPRHHYHDWDGSARGISYVKELGDLTATDSKAGSLYKCVLYLARQQANRRYPLIARTGGLDFGVAPEDQAISTAAFEANGLRANADSRFVGIGPPPRGNQVYWCDPRDRTREVDRLDAARLAQLADVYETDFADDAAVNRWFAEAVENARGAGVHIVSAMAHAMFLYGAPDPFRSLEGGCFDGLDRHLAWVRAQYPEVEFATASEALVEFLDYYTPALEAYVVPTLCGGNPADGTYEFGVRLLGRGIRVDERHAATVRILAPPLFRACDLERLCVVGGGALLGEQTAFDPGSRPAVTVSLTRRAEDLRLQIRARREAIPSLAAWFHEARFVEPREPDRPPLFQLAMPREGRFSTDVLRLLMNPAAGAGDPLGRRIHPLGVFVMGVALTAALESAGEPKAWQPGSRRPLRFRLRWRKAVQPGTDLAADCTQAAEHQFQFRIQDHVGDLVADGEVTFETYTPKEVQAADRNPEEAEARCRELSLRLAESEAGRARLLAGIREFDESFQQTLALYRRERAWKLMLWTRSAYAILFRRGLAAFLRWLPLSLSNTSGYEDLKFPGAADFLERKPPS